MASLSRMKISDLTGDVTMEVQVGRMLRARLWLGLFLVRVACWVMGCGFRYIGEEDA